MADIGGGGGEGDGAPLLAVGGDIASLHEDAAHAVVAELVGVVGWLTVEAVGADEVFEAAADGGVDGLSARIGEDESKDGGRNAAGVGVPGDKGVEGF